VKRYAVQLELLTVDVTTLAGGQGTRYRAELNVKLPSLDTITPDDVKKSIETIPIFGCDTCPATANTTEDVKCPAHQLETVLGTRSMRAAWPFQQATPPTQVPIEW